MNDGSNGSHHGTASWILSPAKVPVTTRDAGQAGRSEFVGCHHRLQESVLCRRLCEAPRRPPRGERSSKEASGGGMVADLLQGCSAVSCGRWMPARPYGDCCNTGISVSSMNDGIPILE